MILKAICDHEQNNLPASATRGFIPPHPTMAKTTEETLAEEDAARAVVAAFQALDRINARDYNKLWKPAGMDRLHSCLLEIQRPGWRQGISVVDDRSAQEIHFLKWRARRGLAFAFRDLEKVVNPNDFKKLWEANAEMQELYKTLRKLEHRVFAVPLLQSRPALQLSNSRHGAP